MISYGLVVLGCSRLDVLSILVLALAQLTILSPSFLEMFITMRSVDAIQIFMALPEDTVVVHCFSPQNFS